MGFTLTGTLEVVKIAKSLADLEGFRAAAKKSGIDLTAAAKGHGLTLNASNDKVLFFRCKMLGYDLPNGNGDSIPRIYASTFGPSFIGTHLDVNHETDPANIIGKVLATFHVEVPILAGDGEERIIGKNALADAAEDSANELQLEGICMIDRTTTLGDDIAKKLISGVLNSVSQEASTDYAECSVCAHRINNPHEDICAHMSNGSLMMESYQVEGKKHKVLAYKVHHNPVGTGLGVVTVPAYGKAKVSDVKAAQKVKADFKSDLLQELQQVMATGDASAEKALAAVESGKHAAILADGDAGKLGVTEAADMIMDLVRVTARKKLKAESLDEPQFDACVTCEKVFTPAEKAEGRVLCDACRAAENEDMMRGEVGLNQDSKKGRPFEARKKLKAQNIELPKAHVEKDLKNFKKAEAVLEEAIADDEEVLKTVKAERIHRITAAQLQALQLDELSMGDLLQDQDKNVWAVSGLEDEGVFLVPDDESRWVTPDELEGFKFWPGTNRVDAAVSLLALSHTYANVHATLDKVLNVAQKSSVIASASGVQGSEGAVMPVAVVASEAGAAYKKLVDDFWGLTAKLDHVVAEVIGAKAKGKKEEVTALAKKLSPEARSLAPDDLISLAHLSRATEAKALFDGLARALNLRSFLFRQAPQTFPTKYAKVLAELFKARKAQDIEAAKKGARELALIESTWTEIPLLAYGVTPYLAPLKVKTGFIAGAEAMVAKPSLEAAKTMLAFLLPKAEATAAPAKLEYFIPAGKTGYTLTVNADGKVVRKYELKAGSYNPDKDANEGYVPCEHCGGLGQHEEGEKCRPCHGTGKKKDMGLHEGMQEFGANKVLANLQGLRTDAAQLEDMSPDQLTLLKKSWQEAKKNLAALVNPDPESMNLIDDEIATIDKHLGATQAPA